MSSEERESAEAMEDEGVILSDVGGEDDGDLDDLTQSDLSEAVVTATDWTTETIVAQLRRGTIQLNPRFQRRDAWTVTRKSRFIESLFLGLPVPQLVLAENRNRRGTYIVLDGKQRLLTLAQFTGQGGFDPFKLRGLDIRDDLNRKSLAQLEALPERVDDLNAFYNQTVRTVVVRNWPDDDFLYLVFLRLNTGNLPLSPQELRQALLPGPFVDFADEASAASSSLRRALRLSAPDFRMRDVELLVRYYAFTHFLESYAGNLKDFLDSTCKRLNASWIDEEDDIRRAAQTADRSIELALDIFGEGAFRRWNGQHFERPFNRAVFDVMTYYFSKDDVIEAALPAPERVVTAFKHLCERDDDFVRSISATTKSMEATGIRYEHWGRALNGALSLDGPVPSLVDGRITRA